MQIRAISGRDEVRLVLQGELDIATASSLGDALRGLDSGAPQVILDLRAVTFVDSHGLQALLEAQAVSREHGREMAVVRGQAEVERVFALVGMDQHLRLIRHPAEAASGASDPRAGSGSGSGHPLARWSSFRSSPEPTGDQFSPVPRNETRAAPRVQEKRL